MVRSRDERLHLRKGFYALRGTSSSTCHARNLVETGNFESMAGGSSSLGGVTEQIKGVVGIRVS